MKSRGPAVLLAVLLAPAPPARAQTDFTFRVELDGILGVVERKKGMALDALTILSPTAVSPDGTVPDVNLSDFELNGLPLHLSVVEIDNTNLFGPSAYGATIVPLLKAFREIKTNCSTSKPPQWASGSAVGQLPPVKIGGNPSATAKVNSDLLTEQAPGELSARWTFRCGELITLTDVLDDNNKTVQIDPGRLVRQGTWGIEKVLNEPRTLKRIALTRTIPAGTKVLLEVGGASFNLSDSGTHVVTVKLRNVPPSEIVGHHVMHADAVSTFAHFRWLYRLARTEDKERAPYYVLFPTRFQGDPFCNGQGVLLEP